jgi:pimeloyl-ACP methyl ester carboxylesterase
MPTIKANDINMYYEVHGEGEPLVLIAGLGTDLTVYGRVINCLSKNFQVLAFDNRGVGRTDMPDIPYSIEMMADDTVALMNTLGVKKANILGISMGSRIAMALALQHPEMVKCLVLTSTFARKRQNTVKSFLRYNILRRLSIHRTLRKYPQPEYAFQRQLKASGSYDCMDRLDRLNVPTLILQGKADKIAPLSQAEEMHTRIKGSNLVTFQGGHIFFMMQLEQFCNAVIEFLKGSGGLP